MANNGGNMTVWKNAKVDTVYYDETEADEGDDCEIRIDGDQIVVSYEDDEGVVLYKGKNHGNGHFQLSSPERNGKATLHMFEGSKILEGFWIQDGNKGFWRISLE